MSSVITVDATVKFLEGNDIHNNVWTRAYEDQLGINAQVTSGWSTARCTTRNWACRSIPGEVPDMFRVSAAQMLLYQEAGLLADLSDVYAKEASAKTRDVLTQDPVALKAATIDGKLWGIPLTDASVATASVLWVRQDWMDKLKHPAPTSMADVLEISRRFTEEDPDGNGANDTVGLCVQKALWGAVAGLQGFFQRLPCLPGHLVRARRAAGLRIGAAGNALRAAGLAEDVCQRADRPRVWRQGYQPGV
jgi:putative aldouronate transport system substrate-binding protein